MLAITPALSLIAWAISCFRASSFCPSSWGSSGGFWSGAWSGLSGKSGGCGSVGAWSCPFSCVVPPFSWSGTLCSGVCTLSCVLGVASALWSPWACSGVSCALSLDSGVLACVLSCVLCSGVCVLESVLSCVGVLGVWAWLSCVLGIWSCIFSPFFLLGIVL